MPCIHILMLFLALTCLTTCNGSNITHNVYSAYALLATESSGETIIYARVIIDPEPSGCPLLVGSQDSILMSRRDNPFSFPVAVCEAIIPFEQAFKVSGSTITIAAVKKNPAQILVYGDSGCKSDDCTGEAQPFATLAAAGSALSPPPDLILHMGDFNYRGTPGAIEIGGDEFSVYDAGDSTPNDPECQLKSLYYSQNASDSPSPDNWNDWWLDFFQPAQELLPMAPWIVTRGNHELCSRAGPGWFYFFGPGSNLAGAATAQYSCPPQGSVLNPDTDVLSHLQFVSPYVVNLGTLRVAVIESANACDGFAPSTTTTLYGNQFDQIDAALDGSVTTWFMTHRPTWGLARQKDGVNTLINTTLQSALRMTSSGALPAPVTLAFGGHMHRYETLTFSDGGPPQIVIGNSGVELVTDDPKGDIAAFDIDGRRAFGNADDKHGFLSISYHPDGSWTGTVIKNDGNTLANCSSANPPATAVCELSEE
jgi:hypothetical protein